MCVVWYGMGGGKGEEGRVGRRKRGREGEKWKGRGNVRRRGWEGGRERKGEREFIRRIKKGIKEDWKFISSPITQYVDLKAEHSSPEVSDSSCNVHLQG